MSTLVVETPEGLVLQRDLAGAGSRAAAGALDALLWALVFFGFALLMSLVLPDAVAIVLAGGTVLLVAYHVLFPMFWNGQTPGKRLLGLTVVDERGLPATPMQHALRGLLFPAEAFVLVPVPLGLLLVLATERHQRLGDLVAGTQVVRDVGERGGSGVLARTRWSELKERRLPLVPAHAARFEAEDLDLLRQLIGRRGFEAEARRRLLKRALAHYLARLDFEPFEVSSAKEARNLLGELYLFVREMRTGR